MSNRQHVIAAIASGLMVAGIACNRSAAPPAASRTVILDYAPADPDARAAASVAADSNAATDKASTPDAPADPGAQSAPDTPDAAAVLTTAIDRASKEQKLLLVHVGAPG